MKTRIRTQIRHALVIRAIDLRAIWSVLGEVYTKISATARCLDGSILETNDIDEIVVFDNPSFRRIESLEFEARTKLDESVEIQIRGDTSALLYSTTTASVSITAYLDFDRFVEFCS